MDRKSMAPHGAALLAYQKGDRDAILTIRRDDGFVATLPVAHFFRPRAEFTPLEIDALGRCQGHVLDVGAGTGLHAEHVQRLGHTVTAIDICPAAVDVMRNRGIGDVSCVDVFDLAGSSFDTVLLLGHGIGMVENLEGLDRFLDVMRPTVKPDGIILVHSLDVTQTDDPSHLAYQQSNINAGRYVGETRVRFEFAGTTGPFCGWLHVDPVTLARHALARQWSVEIVTREDTGEFLAQLEPV